MVLSHFEYKTVVLAFVSDVLARLRRAPALKELIILVEASEMPNIKPKMHDDDSNQQKEDSRM